MPAKKKTQDTGFGSIIAAIFDQDRRLIARAGGLLALKNGRIVRAKPKAAPEK